MHKPMTKEVDGWEVVDDYPPQRVAHDAAQAIKDAMECCAFSSGQQFLLNNAIRMLEEMANS